MLNVLFGNKRETLILDGMDNCLKDTLIDIYRKYQKYSLLEFHAKKPPKFDTVQAQIDYQLEYNKLLVSSIKKSKGDYIFNRSHLSEYVYSILYRNYEYPEYIFSIENTYRLDLCKNLKLVVIVDSNLEKLKMREDGNSLSGIKDDLLKKEISLFKEAFQKTKIKNKIFIDLISYYLPDSDRIDVNRLCKSIFNIDLNQNI